MNNEDETFPARATDREMNGIKLDKNTISDQPCKQPVFIKINQSKKAFTGLSEHAGPVCEIAWHKLQHIEMISFPGYAETSARVSRAPGQAKKLV